MKNKMFRKLMAASLATAMTVSMVGCGGKTEAPAEEPVQEEATEEVKEEATEEVVEEVEEESEYPVLTDANGDVYDLGGMEIIIRDWWSGEPAEPSSAYEEDTLAYREWIQETYNFTIKQQAISDWTSTPTDFVEYASAPDDGNNYVWILRDDPAITSAISQGLMYDLSTLDCIDFSEEKFQLNKLHEQYSKGDAIYAMYSGASEPRTGVYFNKRLLTDAGIDPETIYDMQADGTWTWDAFTDLLEKTTRDTDNDGVIDVYGITQNASNLTNALVWSNNAEYVGKDASGKYEYKLENPETLEALEKAVEIFDKYTLVYPEGANWDYYKEAYLNGGAVFMCEDGYAGTPGNFLQDMADDFGFVMFPKGPNASDYTNCWTNNPAAISANYDADKAWKIAFAWNLYNTDTPGYENTDSWKDNYYNGFRDTRSVDESLAMMREKGMITYDGMIPSMKRGEDLTWGITAGTDVSAAVEAIRDTWKSYIDEANK